MYLIHLSRVRFSCSNKINNLRCGTLLAVQRISNRLTKSHDQWPNFIKVSHFIFWHLAKGGNMLRNLLINFGMFALLFVGISGGTWFVSDAAASEPQKAEAVESPTLRRLRVRHRKIRRIHARHLHRLQRIRCRCRPRNQVPNRLLKILNLHRRLLVRNGLRVIKT